MRQPYHIASHGWIVAAKPKPEAAKRLYCFSHAGAGGAAYRGWADAAPAWLEVCTIHLPGRENRLREPAFSSVREIVPPLVDALLAIHDRPFAFFGHSMGAIVAFETARALRAGGHPMPEALFVSASRAPQLQWPHPPIRQLSDLELLAEVHRRYGSVPAIIMEDEELRALLTPTLRADMAAVETYSHGLDRVFEFPILAFGGDHDPMVGRPELEAWSEQTTGGFRFQMVPGDHLFLQAQRATLLAEVARTLGSTGSIASRYSASAAE
jgi:surfactin synthase thioesterase subunit